MKPEVVVMLVGMLILTVSFFLPIKKVEFRVLQIALSAFSTGLFVANAIYTFLK